VDAAVRAAVSVLADAGVRVDEVDPGFADPVQAFHVLWFSGEAKALEPYGDTVDDRVDPGLRRGEKASTKTPRCGETFVTANPRCLARRRDLSVSRTTAGLWRRCAM
jgi:hypothetical protein